jgi:hypothetical protein
VKVVFYSGDKRRLFKPRGLIDGGVRRAIALSGLRNGNGIEWRSGNPN